MNYFSPSQAGPKVNHILIYRDRIPMIKPPWRIEFVGILSKYTLMVVGDGKIDSHAISCRNGVPQ